MGEANEASESPALTQVRQETHHTAGTRIIAKMTMSLMRCALLELGAFGYQREGEAGGGTGAACNAHRRQSTGSDVCLVNRRKLVWKESKQIPKVSLPKRTEANRHSGTRLIEGALPKTNESGLQNPKPYIYTHR